MKKWLSLLCALVMVLSMIPLAFASADEMVTISYIIPGGDKDDHELVEAALNEKLAKDLGIQIKMTFIPWDAWEQKTNLMLSTGEEFDLFHVAQDHISLAAYYGRGGVADLTDAINQYGQNILALIPEDSMAGVTFDGHIYAIPSAWCELGVEGSFTYREDLLKKYGYELPTTNAEMLDIVEGIIAKWEGDELPYLSISCDYNPTSNHLTVLHSEYDSFPFNVFDGLFMVDQNGNVQSWVESEEFKADAAWMHEAYERGLLDPDILNMGDMFNNKKSRGEFIFHFGTTGYGSDMQASYPDMTKDDLKVTRLHAEKGAVRPWAFKNGNAVSSTSKHVEEAVKFVNWLYDSQENYNLLLYGVEGTHFSMNDDGSMNKLTSGWGFSTYLIGNMKYNLFDTWMAPDQIRAQYTTDPTAVNSVAGGFFMDTTPVQTEYTNVLSEMQAVIKPIVMGVVSYEDGFESALKRLKDAGLDKVMDEYKRQFAEYQAKYSK